MVLRTFGVGFVALALLAGCDDQGFSRVGDEWDRRHAGPYYVVSAAPERAVVSARGRQVAIVPAEGFCLARESVEASRLSAFALIGDCALDTPTDDAPRGARGELQLPRGLPGIITVSVSGDPGFSGTGPEEVLDGLGRYLDTSEGRRLLGRSGNGGAVEVVETRRIGNGIYVLVEDQSAGPVPVLDQRFWRAFVELNARMTVVTVSGFRARPLGEDNMLKHLVAQVDRLQLANQVPVNEPGVQVASADRERSREVRTLSDIEPEPLVVTTATPPANEGSAPVPLGRPTPQEEAQIEQALADATAEVQGEVPTELAPERAIIPRVAARSPAAPSDETLAKISADPPAEPPAEAPARSGTAPEATAEIAAVASTGTSPETTGDTVLRNPAVAGQGAPEPATSQADAAPAIDPARQIAADPVGPDEDAAPTRFAPTSAPAAPRRPRQA